MLIFFPKYKIANSITPCSKWKTINKMMKNKQTLFGSTQYYTYFGMICYHCCICMLFRSARMHSHNCNIDIYFQNHWADDRFCIRNLVFLDKLEKIMTCNNLYLQWDLLVYYVRSLKERTRKISNGYSNT